MWEKLGEYNDSTNTVALLTLVSLLSYPLLLCLVKFVFRPIKTTFITLPQNELQEVAKTLPRSDEQALPDSVDQFL